MIRRYLPLAHGLANRHAGRGIPRDDLQQVAALGLVKAVDRFDPARGRRFVDFAVPTITGELRRYFRDCGWTIRPPRRLQEVQATVNAAEPDLQQARGRTPTLAELAEATGATREDILESQALAGCFSPHSLDAPTRGGTTSLSDALGTTDPEFGRVDAHLALGHALSTLRPRDRNLVVMRYGAEMTQEEIAMRMGLSQAQVSRSLRRVLDHLRHLLECD